MSDMIEDLIARIQADQATKLAAEDTDAKKDEKDQGEKDEEKKDVPPWLKEKEKGAAEQLAELEASLPEHVKAAMQLDAALQLEADLAQRSLIFGQAKQAGELPIETVREIFDAAFNDQIEKFAMQDPDFAEILFMEQAKQAFNAGYAQATAG